MSEHNAIISTIERYIEGGRLGQSEIMKESFADDAVIYSVADGKLEGGPIQTLYDVVDKMGPAPNLTYEIGTIDVNRTTATARVELFDWAGMRFTDQYALLKVDGKWKIMAKVYCQRD